MADDTDETSRSDEFAAAAERRRSNVLSDFWGFARANRKWWLTPVIVILLLVGLLLVLAATGAGPLIYPLF